MWAVSLLRISSAFPLLSHQMQDRIGGTLPSVGLGHDEWAGCEAGGKHAHQARHEQTGAHPIGEHFHWAIGGAPGSAAGRRAQSRRASHGPTAPTSTRLPNTAIRMAGIEVHPGAHRRQQVEHQPVEQRQRHEGRPHPRAPQPPADAGGPEALFWVHRGQGSLRKVDELWVAQLGLVPYREASALQESSGRSARRARFPTSSSCSSIRRCTRAGAAPSRATCRWARSGTGSRGSPSRTATAADA